MGGYVGAGVETKASSVATWAHGADVAILSTTKTLGVAVGGVVKGEGPGAWRWRPVCTVVKLAAEVIFDFLGGCLEEVVRIGGAGVDPVMDTCTVFGVVIGAQEGLPVAEAFDRGEGVAVVALGDLCRDDLVLILLILNRDGDVIGEVVPVGLDTVLKRLVVHVDAGVGRRLGNVAGECVSDVPKWDNGEGISVMDRTLYDLRVCKETS
jgi:hypothetical protein